MCFRGMRRLNEHRGSDLDTLISAIFQTLAETILQSAFGPFLQRYWRHLVIATGLVLAPIWTLGGVIAGLLAPTRFWRITALVACVAALELLRSLWVREPLAMNLIFAGSIVAYIVAVATFGWRGALLVKLFKVR